MVYDLVWNTPKDKRVNVFDALDYSTVSAFESDSPILSMSLSQRDSTMALGMAGGFISVAQRSTKTTMLVSSLPSNDTNIKYILFSVMM